MTENNGRADIKSMLPAELSKTLSDMGEPAFRAKQVFKWLSSGVSSFDEMSNLPKALWERLAERFYLTYPYVERKQVSAVDGTVKYLWRLLDGNHVESVVMRYEHGNTVCVSSEVGCPMGCAFCATGRNGFTRNLTAREIVDQVGVVRRDFGERVSSVVCASTIGGKVRNLSASEILDQVIFAQLDSGMRISNIVLMGIGEPLDNFDNVVRFLRLVNDPEGMNIGMRHISLSTCGLAEGIDKLAELDLQLTLSVSLHAPDNETRGRIMPVNRAYDVDTLLAACGRYFRRTGRRISYEYAMIRDVNDTPYHASLLADRLAGSGSHVNLIPLNEVPESRLRPSTPEAMRSFIGILEKRGINVTVRRKLGPDIEASCGQLRREREKN